MSKPARIYTRSGDDGTTGLVGGERIRKSAGRIAAYGTVDELSSVIGVSRAALREPGWDHPVSHTIDAWLAWTQDALFNLGSELATPRKAEAMRGPRVGTDDALALEHAIDEAQDQVPPLTQFISPGGSLPGAQLHVARTICRRAERLVVMLRQEEPGGASDDAMKFLNRLSDALFVWARWINHAAGEPEHVWNSESRPPSRG
jgi:cob(I)alamin adenosyltransferase